MAEKDSEPNESGVVQLVSAGPTPIFTTSELTQELRQSEIITGLIQYTFDPSTESVEEIVRQCVIVASQDCDLKWDYESRRADNGSQLNGVLLYEAQAASQVKTTFPGRDLWKPVIQNSSDRYQFVEVVPKEYDLVGDGLPALVVDFKRLFTVPASEIERQIADGTARRRCRLEMPYREHFQSRAEYYLQRVGLPAPHKFDQNAFPTTL